MKNALKTLAIIVVSAVAVMVLQGCKISAGVIVTPPYHHGYPHGHNHCWVDYWGMLRCDHYTATLGLDQTGGDKYFYTTNDERVAKVSERYNISHYAATYVVRAVLFADQNDMTGVKELGLTEADIKTVGDGGSLSAQKLDKLSQKLMMKPSETKKLIAKLAADIKAAQ